MLRYVSWLVSVRTDLFTELAGTANRRYMIADFKPSRVKQRVPMTMDTLHDVGR